MAANTHITWRSSSPLLASCGVLKIALHESNPLSLFKSACADAGLHCSVRNWKRCCEFSLFETPHAELDTLEPMPVRPCCLHTPIQMQRSCSNQNFIHQMMPYDGPGSAVEHTNKKEEKGACIYAFCCWEPTSVPTQMIHLMCKDVHTRHARLPMPVPHWQSGTKYLLNISSQPKRNILLTHDAHGILTAKAQKWQFQESGMCCSHTTARPWVNSMFLDANWEGPLYSSLHSRVRVTE